MKHLRIIFLILPLNEKDILLNYIAVCKYLNSKVKKNPDLCVCRTKPMLVLLAAKST